MVAFSALLIRKEISMRFKSIFALLGFCFLVGSMNALFAQTQPAKHFKIVTRKEWGWKPPTFTLPEHQIKRITIHHSGVIFKQDEDVVKYLRHLQEWSRTEKHWMDIPYHYMIAPDGTIYEARPLKYPGDTNTTYNPRGHALICVLGNFEIQTPTKDQLEALAWLSAKLALEYHVGLDSIKSHKDYAETLCPGKNLYRYLQDGSLQKEIKYYENLISNRISTPVQSKQE